MGLGGPGQMLVHLPAAWPHPGVNPVYKPHLLPRRMLRTAGPGQCREGPSHASNCLSPCQGPMLEGTSGPAHALFWGTLRPRLGKDMAKFTKQVGAPRKKRRDPHLLSAPTDRPAQACQRATPRHHVPQIYSPSQTRLTSCSFQGPS